MGYKKMGNKVNAKVQDSLKHLKKKYSRKLTSKMRRLTKAALKKAKEAKGRFKDQRALVKKAKYQLKALQSMSPASWRQSSHSAAKFRPLEFSPNHELKRIEMMKKLKGMKYLGMKRKAGVVAAKEKAKKRKAKAKADTAKVKADKAKVKAKKE